MLLILQEVSRIQKTQAVLQKHLVSIQGCEGFLQKFLSFLSSPGQANEETARTKSIRNCGHCLMTLQLHSVNKSKCCVETNHDSSI